MPQIDAPRPNQLVALEALLRGETVSASAAAASVSRETVHRWKRTPGPFAEALSDGQREARVSARARLLALTTAALTAVETGLNSGTPWQRARVGLRLLEGLGHLTGHVQLDAAIAATVEGRPSAITGHELRDGLDPDELATFLQAARSLSRELRGEEVVEPEVAAAGVGESRQGKRCDFTLFPSATQPADHPVIEEPEEDHLARALRAFRRG